MSDLFIDVGNSRIKFALLDQSGYEYLGAYAQTQLEEDRHLRECLEGLEVTPDRIYICSVGSSSFEHRLRESITVLWSVLPVFMATQSHFGALKNGYSDPYQLGVDRWMAMIGARNLVSGPFVVIDAGTAITIDAVNVDNHLGGLIVPGLQTLRHALVSQTAKLSEQCDGLLNEPPPSLLARDTQLAVCGGTLYMAAAFLNTLLVDLYSEMGNHFEIVVTGGDSKALSSLMSMECIRVEDLVLKGMVEVCDTIKK
jgi:type III pantothenate kinase